MTSIRLQIQVGDVRDTLKSIHLAFADASPFTGDVLGIMLRSTQLNFEQQGRPKKWDELAPSTKRARMRKLAAGGRSKKKLAQLAGSMLILRNTGHLLQSVGGGASGPFEQQGGFGQSDRDSAIIGTDNPGGYNQWPNPRTGAPARLIFVWQDQDERDVLEMADDWFTRSGPYAE